MLHLMIQAAADTTAVATGGGMDVTALFTPAAAIIVILLTQVVKNLSTKLKDGPDWLKAAISGVLGMLVGTIQSATGVAVTGDIFTWGAALWQGLIVWGMGMGYHALAKKTVGA